MRLDTAFEPRNNSLNAVRLVLAIGVIFWHSFPLTGTAAPTGPSAQFLSEVWVDGFFAVSGFLILSSWVRRPEAWAYLRARCLRILPAFYVCLLVTAFVFAPLSLAISGTSANWLPGSLQYLANNVALWIREFGIAGTLEDVPFPRAWNGSLWTLGWEFSCYLAVLVLGVVRLARKPAVFATAAIGCWVGLLIGALSLVDEPYLHHASRFGLMFVCGAVLYLLQDKVPANWPLVGMAAAVLVGSMWLPDYRLVAALPLAYICIVVGALVKNPKQRWRNDLCYGLYIFAFPIQQLLATAGFAEAGVTLFFLASLACTLIFAAASWFWVEKPSLSWKSRESTHRRHAKLRPENSAVE